MPYTRPDDSWVLEGVMTTLAPPEDGLLDNAPSADCVNIAPMGPIVDASMSRLVLRPFRSSTTYRNLKATGEGVFHVTDDALLIARAVIGRVAAGSDVPTRQAERVRGVVLTGACRYYELKVSDLDDRQERVTITAEVVHTGRLRDFIGFNRARHAVLEAAILATRLRLTGPALVLAEFDRLDVMVAKTGGPDERRAMAELRAFAQGAG
jgi:uncharacterized protein